MVLFIHDLILSVPGVHITILSCRAYQWAARVHANWKGAVQPTLMAAVGTSNDDGR